MIDCTCFYLIFLEGKFLIMKYENYGDIEYGVYSFRYVFGENRGEIFRDINVFIDVLYKIKYLNW